jgi:predicted membrane chloride channel (bestrophin family)
MARLILSILAGVAAGLIAQWLLFRTFEHSVSLIVSTITVALLLYFRTKPKS